MKYPISRLGLFLLLTTLSACRFGNYSEDPKPNIKDDYKSVTLYFTQAQSLETLASYNDNTSNSNAHAPLAAIPTSVRNTFTNPTYFAIPKDATQLPIFVGLNQTNYISTTLDSSGAINDDYFSNPTQLWKHASCTTQIEIKQVGTFDTSHPGTVVFGDGSQSPVAGHIRLTFTYYRYLDGDCVADLQELAQCYTSGTGCDTDQLNAASNLFDLYVRQTGVLDMSKVSRLNGLAYQIIYE